MIATKSNKREHIKVIQWIDDFTICVDGKEYEILCELANGHLFFQENGSENILVFQKRKLIQGFFSLEAERVKDLLMYMNSLPDLEISMIRKDFETLCIDILKGGKICPCLYNELLPDAKRNRNLIQIIAFRKQKSVLSKNFWNLMKEIKNHTVQAKDIKIKNLYPNQNT